MKSPSWTIRILCFVLVALLAQAPVSGAGSAAPAETYEFGDFALYLPAEVPTVRGILLVLGGPDTRAFVSDGVFGAPVPELEASLHIQGQELRTLAADQRLAILGTSLKGQAGLPDLPRT
ncbi:hypothetical protein ACFL00_04025, partial [Pseudomonadota bacterium]